MIILPIFGAVFMLIPLVFLFKWRKMNNTGIRTEGTIVEFQRRKNARSAFPVVTFQTIGNISITKVPDFSSFPTKVKVGDKVSIIYNPDDPNDFIVESGPGRSIAFLLIGLALIIIWGALKWKQIEF
ncbi:DUF3592 domain-containing protein [Paraflavitalea soli]|uniref:DUF3592 domain-containing protein n=1 Tax=Paraflavitalea soli TaxID=2315862 RepID=A0A3B7ML37_9BACT|nr:DUF3592 domain-containing protein [Paraflavitalea soli]AXY73726.1 DUF3592 domain-containing protein [Paraflavitalea soli]